MVGICLELTESTEDTEESTDGPGIPVRLIASQSLSACLGLTESAEDTEKAQMEEAHDIGCIPMLTRVS